MSRFSLAFVLFAFVSLPAFAAAPFVLDYPCGGEVFVVGTQQQVRLNRKFKSGLTLTVELSRDGGVTFSSLGEINTSRVTAPTLDFEVSGPVSSNCIIRVYTSLWQGVFTRESAPFSIVAAVASGGVTKADLANDSVTSPKIAPGTVTKDHISSAPASSGFVLTADGAGKADWKPFFDTGSAQNIFKYVGDGAGNIHFTAGSNADTLQFQGTGGATVTFDGGNKRILINAPQPGVTQITAGGPLSVSNGTTTPAISINESLLNHNAIGGTLSVSKGGTGATSLNGILVGNGTSSINSLKANLTATVAPGASDDSVSGYAVGSRWVDVVAKTEYVLTDASPGAAVWKETTSAIPSGYSILGATAVPPSGYTHAGATIQASTQGLQWVQKEPIPSPSELHGAVNCNGKIYVIGGWNFAWMATNQVYDPATNSWSTLAPMPTARNSHALAAVGNVIYAIGGVDSNGNTSANEAYNTTTNTWSTKANLPTSRSGLSAAVVNGVIYTFAGSGTDVTEAYDPSTNTWSIHPPMPNSRSFVPAIPVGNLIYICGGYDQSPSPSSITHAYDTVNKTWIAKAPLPVGRFGYGAGVVNGKIYLAGGYDKTPYTNTTLVYDPDADSWSAGPLMSKARYAFSAVTVNNVLYAISGSGTDGILPFEPSVEALTTTTTTSTFYIHTKN